MTFQKSIIAVLFIVLYSCGEKAGKNKVDSEAVDLNNRAMALLPSIHNPDSSKKAIALLDKATSVDSNYFLGHYNKLMFYAQLKEFNNAILTINQLIRLRPSAHDLYLTGGVLYEQSGDSISARRFYEKSLAICTITLDSMNKKNTAYEMLLGNKAINYIMLGDTTKANEILGTLLANQTDGEMKRITLSMMNKNRDELLRQFSLPNPTSN